jgi:hypothetical protein
MLTSKQVKEMARAMGADAVAIGNIERWEGAPTQQDPRQIMPEARSVIAMAFRVMRGSLRGIEEGTFFSNYSSMGYGGITYLYMPMTVINLAKALEDTGYEAIPYGHQSDWRAVGQEGALRPNYSPPGRARPRLPGCHGQPADCRLSVRAGRDRLEQGVLDAGIRTAPAGRDCLDRVGA